LDKLSPALKIKERPIPIVSAHIELKLVIMISLDPNFPEISDVKIELKMTKKSKGVAAALMSVITTLPISPKEPRLVPKIFPTMAPRIKARII
jgi:hypothetical protein